jgi:hypothetical protein
MIASESPGRLVVQPEVISVRLDDPKAILETPTKTF